MKTTRRNFIRNIGGTTAAMAAGTGLVFAGSTDISSHAVPENLPDPSADITWKFLRANFKMNWTLEPSADRWDKVNASGPDDIRGIYKSNGYTLVIDAEDQGKAAVVRFNITRSDRQRFKVHAYKIACNTSQSGVYKIFTPGMMQQQHYKIDLPFEFTTVSRAENDFPVLWMQQTDGTNTLTLGLLDQVGRAVLRGTTYLGNDGGEAPGIANKYASVSLERTMGTAGNIDSFEDGLYVNADTAISWFDALTRYSEKADAFRGYTAVTLFSDWAFNPMWHSWYAHASDIDETIIRRDSALAKNLGVKTIEIDAGWNIAPGVGYTLDVEGDYYFDTGRFPGAVDMIKQMHANGQRVILHVSPLVMGPGAKARKILEDGLIRVKGEPTLYLDPRLEKVHAYLLEAWERLFTYYGVDGLWYDFLEIPEEPDAPSPGAVVLYTDIREAFTRLMQALFKKSRAIVPDAVVILRRGSANLNAKTYCTHVWPMDVPQDYNMNRRDVLFMKTYGKGVLTHACCTSWTISEIALNVARQMSSIVVAGVPSFSVLLKESPTAHNRIIRAWLSFYEKNKRDLVEGQMKPLLPTPPSAVLYTKGENQVFIGFFEAVTGVINVDPVDTVTVINAYNHQTATRLEGLSGKWRMTVFDHEWAQIREQSIQADAQNGLMLNVKTELGCHIIVLKKR